MKTIRLILAAALCACVLFITGCASHAIEKASTSLKVSNGLGKTIEISLPKNLDATELEVQVDPATGQYHLKAKTIKTDASTVIESAATAQANAIGKLSEAVITLAPLATQPKP